MVSGELQILEVVDGARAVERTHPLGPGTVVLTDGAAG